MKNENLKTATALTHAAAILQVVFTMFAIIAVFLAFGVASMRGGPGSGVSFLVALVGALGIIAGIVWCWIDNNLIYSQMKRGKYSSISTAMLIAGLLQLFLGGTIPGVLILIAWAIAKGG